MAIEEVHLSCNATPGEGPDFQAMTEVLGGPAQVDQFIRLAIRTCFMVLPAGKRTTDEVETQIRRMTDLVLADLREDREAFGLGSPVKPCGSESADTACTGLTGRWMSGCLAFTLPPARGILPPCPPPLPSLPPPAASRSSCRGRGGSGWRR